MDNRTIDEVRKNEDRLINKIELLEKENQELKKQIEELEFIVGLRQKRNLISKFDKEYDEEDKKKNPNRDYAGIMPDAEEIYRRYYTMKNQQKEFIEYLEDEIKRLEENNIYQPLQRMALETYKHNLLKYKEITGGKIMKYFYEYKIKNGAKVGGHNLEKIAIKDNVIILEGVDTLMDCDGEYDRQWSKFLKNEEIEYLRIFPMNKED